MSFTKCMVNLSLGGKIRHGEIKEAAAVYEKRGMASEAALQRAVEDKLKLAEMEEKSIVKSVRGAYEAKGGVVASNAPQATRTIEVDGKRRPIENSKGQPIADTFAKQQAFWRWFGDSTVAVLVNAETGEPLRSSKEPAVSVPEVMYHTTKNTFDVFEAGRPTINSGTFGDWETKRHAIFVTSDADASHAYGKSAGEFAAGANIMPLYVKANNPLDMTSGFVERRVADQFEEAGLNPRWLYQFDWTKFDDEDGKHFVEVAKTLGYDSVIFNDENPDTGDSFEAWAVFDPKQIKSATGNAGTFDATNPSIVASRRPVFYSALARAIPAMSKVADKNGMIKPEQARLWLQARQKEGKFKADELQWSGVDDWLKTREGKVSVDDIALFLEENGVQVEEVEKGSMQHIIDAARAMVSEVDQLGFDTLSEAMGALRRDMNRMADADEVMDQYDLTEQERAPIRAWLEANDLADDKTKYGQYVLPGGENYRELLLTIPVKARGGFATIDDDGYINERFDTEKEARAAAERDGISWDRAATEDTGGIYTSSHWGEKNIVAHIRFNDRTGADGKRVLFIEELQSDWGQAILKKGIGNFTVEQAGDWWNIKNPSGEVVDQQSSKSRAQEVAAQMGGPQAAPFVTDTKAWLALGIKRMIRYAAENGYDKVAFVNGDQSATRYDLSKQISSIQYEPIDNGNFEVEAKDMKGMNVFAEDDIPLSRVEEALGKEIAQKIANGEGRKDQGGYRNWHYLEGMDLKVGGEGMKAFYDKIVPQTINDVLKKLGGGRAGTVDLGGPDKVRRHELIRERRDLPMDDPRRAVLDGEIDRLSRMETGSAAPMSDQTGFDITPELRESALGGMPMFSKRATPTVTITAGTRGHYQLKPETRTQTARRALQDYFLRMKVVQEAIAEQGGTVDEAQDVYQAESLSYGRLQENLRDFKTKEVEPLLKAVEAADLTLDDLALYAYAMHAGERNAAKAAQNPSLDPDEGSGMTDQEASDILEAFRQTGDEPALQALHAKLEAIIKGTRDAMLKDGLISQDEYNKRFGSYQHYVPLRGFIEDEYDAVDKVNVRGMSHGGKGFNVKQPKGVRALGRTSRAGHIIENIISDRERTVALAERNEVAKVFVNFMLTNPDPKLWEVDPVRTRASFDKGTQTVDYTQVLDKGEDVISAMINGKEVFVKIKDPLLLRAMRQASKDETGAITRALGKALGWYTAFMRNVLTRFNPAFGAANAIKDFEFATASVLADLGPEGVPLFAKYYSISGGANWRAEMDKPDMGRAADIAYQEYRAAGGTTGGWHMRDLQEMRKELQNLMVEYGAEPKTLAQRLIATPGLKQGYKASKKFLRVLELVGALSENQARFAAFRAAREMGHSPAKSASVAKELTTNFNRKGEWGSAMNTSYLFFNAGVQGSAKLLSNLKSPYVKALMAAGTGLAMGLALMGAAVGGDDDDGEAFWDKIPEFEKQRNLIIMLPPGKDADGAFTVGSRGRYLKIPVQYGINAFTNLGYTLADLGRNIANPARGRSPVEAAVSTVSSIFGSFNPLGGAVDVRNPADLGMAVAPSIADVGIQFAAGVDGFGRPTSSPKSPYDERPDSQNFSPAMAGTWEQRLAVWMNDKSGGDEAVSGTVDLAPGTIRNLKRNLTGGTGDFLSAVVVNIPSKLMSPEAEVGFRDMPIVKGLYGRIDSTVDMSQYYEHMKEALAAAGNAKRRAAMGIRVDLDEESAGLTSLGEAAKTFTDAQTQLRKASLRIMKSEDISDGEKRIRVKELQARSVELARRFNAVYYGMEQERAKK